MNQSISIRIPDDVRKNLEATSKKEGKSLSDLVRESLQKYITVYRFRQLRNKEKQHESFEKMEVDMRKSLLLFFVIVQLFFSCSRQPVVEDKKAEPKTVKEQKTEPSLEVVATKWINHAASTYSQLSWTDSEDERGLVIILHKKVPADLTIHSNDFVLVFDSQDDIPRRPCLGISNGMKSPTDTINWGIVGSLSRYWIKLDEPYFALIFPAPKKVKKFSIYFATPLLPDITAPEKF
jgi:hypothetical protein